MQNIRTTMLLVALTGSLAGCKKEDDKADPADNAPAITAADYFGNYLGTTQGTSDSYPITVSTVDGNTIRFSANWGEYTSAEAFNADINGNTFTIPVQTNWVQHNGTTGGNNETFEGTGVRNGDALQLQLTVKGYYPPEMGGGVFSTWNWTVVASRQ